DCGIEVAAQKLKRQSYRANALTKLANSGFVPAEPVSSRHAAALDSIRTRPGHCFCKSWGEKSVATRGAVMQCAPSAPQIASKRYLGGTCHGLSNLSKAI